MANDRHVLALTDLNSVKNHWEQNPSEPLDVSGAEFKDRDYAGAKLTPGEFEGCRLERVSFSRCGLTAVRMRRAKIENCTFDQALCNEATFQETRITASKFRETNLQTANFQDIIADDVDFSRSSMESANFSKAKISKGSFANAVLRSADFRYSELKEADFSGADLARAQFELADLSNADLRRANLHGADLKGANVTGAKIRRYDLEDLKAFDYCGLKPSQIQEMLIEDGYGEMRAHFSGFWTYIHALSILLWFFPIAWIVVRSLLLSHLTIGVVENRTVEISLLNQIAGYCISGRLAPSKITHPPYWDYPWSYFFFSTWLIILLYNVARARVIFKVKQLEHRQTITGMHPLVTLEGELKWCYRIANFLFWVNLALALSHFGNFLLTEFPAPVR